MCKVFLGRDTPKNSSVYSKSIDAYVLTLKRSGKSRDEIGEMMGTFYLPGNRTLSGESGYG
jgi:hypothetical protein